MKRLILFVVLIAMCFSLTGCGNLIDEIISNRGHCPGENMGVPCDNVKAQGVIAVSFDDFKNFCVLFAIVFAIAAFFAAWAQHVKDNNQDYQIEKYLHETMELYNRQPK